MTRDSVPQATRAPARLLRRRVVGTAVLTCAVLTVVTGCGAQDVDRQSRVDALTVLRDTCAQTADLHEAAQKSVTMESEYVVRTLHNLRRVADVLRASPATAAAADVLDRIDRNETGPLEVYQTVETLCLGAETTNGPAR